MAFNEVALDFSRLLPSTAGAATSSDIPASPEAGGCGSCGGYVRDIADVNGHVRPPDEQVTIYFREHSSAVFRYLAGVYGREEDAEEVTQEAFLRLHQALVA